MTIPVSLLTAGIAKTLRETYAELLERLDNRGARVFQGQPDEDNIPDDPHQVWVSPGPFDGNDGGQPKSVTQTSIVTTWFVTILRIQKATHEPYSVDMFETIDDMGTFGEAITSTIADMTLDGKVEWMEEPRGEFLLPPPSAVGNRRITGVTFELVVHHGPDPTRCQT